jgi:hypothetical protein
MKLGAGDLHAHVVLSDQKIAREKKMPPSE